jgi:hypothetical protein
MHRFLLVFLLFCSPALADGIPDVAEYLSANSVLPLLNGEASDLATNLLKAQAATGLNTLQLSEDAVLRAIGLEASIFHMTECDPSNCEVAWAQSTLAIDPNAAVTFDPPSLDFGPKVVTPEPASGLLLLAAAIAACILGRRRPPGDTHVAVGARKTHLARIALQPTI